jgi:putative transposase
MVRDREVIDWLLAEVDKHPSRGFWKCFDRARHQGRAWNHKRVHRVYCGLRLNVPRRTKRRLATRLRQPLVAPISLNGIWAVDFMHDALYSGRTFRTFNAIDEANREALVIEAGVSIPSRRVTRVLDQAIEMYGRPAAIRCDNGPEFIAQHFQSWCEDNKIEILFIQPGKPNQNAFIERFNRTFRQEVLGAYLFESVRDVQEIADAWLRDYNENRPHDSLGRIPPTQYLARPLTPKMSSFQVCA